MLDWSVVNGQVRHVLTAAAGAADGVGERAVPAEPRFPAGSLAATATVDEIERALKYYRAHKARERDRHRAKRAAGDHKG